MNNWLVGQSVIDLSISAFKNKLNHIQVFEE